MQSVILEYQSKECIHQRILVNLFYRSKITNRPTMARVVNDTLFYIILCTSYHFYHTAVRKTLLNKVNLSFVCTEYCTRQGESDTFPPKLMKFCIITS